MYGPENVEEVIFGNAVATETTVATFIASASDKEIKVLSADGSAPAAGDDFKVYQKTAGNAAKGLNYEFSDTVKADKVDKVILATYLPETQKVVVFSSFPTPVANTTYAIEVRLYNDGGTLSPENFATITGYYVTGSVAPNVATLIQGLADSLSANLLKRGGSEIAVTYDSTTLTLTGIAQTVVPGKIIGKQIEFEATSKVFANASITHENTSTIVATVTPSNPGRGTGKYAVNLEWFSKGTKYEVYRGTSYPADFNTPYYAEIGGIYNVIHIKYYSDRLSPTLEKQPKVLTIFVNKGTDILANNAATNAVLADLRTILGTANVPGDLPVSE